MHIRSFRFVLVIMLAHTTFFSYAQSVIVQKGVHLPKDSIVSGQLISSLNGFLSQKEKPNRENTFVLKENLLETSALLDELKQVERNINTKDNNFYKCYVTNVVKLNDDDFIIQFSYTGVSGDAPIQRASFKLKAKRENGQFYFYSPLKQNTVSWKIKRVGSITWHYKDTMNKSDIKAFEAAIQSYDKRLKSPVLSFDSYYCDNLPEALQVVGIEYESDNNGVKNGSLSSHEDKRDLYVNGGSYYGSFFDPHDLWHDRLRTVMNPTVINRPVDEGCAYLYGGSWGYTWDEVLIKFKKYVAANPNADWLTLYMDVTNFEGGEKPLKVAYVLNALIAQKIEKEKGFAPVMELLGCGKKEKGDENYFKALEKVTGINKANFNTKMAELLRSLQ